VNRTVNWQQVLGNVYLDPAAQGQPWLISNHALLQPWLVSNEVNWDIPKVYTNVPSNPKADPFQEVEAATKALREAKGKDAQRKAADALDKALKKVREQIQ
jgi:hypothetical protein